MTADIKDIFLVDCHGPFGFNFLVTAVYLLTIYMFVLLENHKRRVRGPASNSVTTSKMPLLTTSYNFIEVLDGPFTMVLFIGIKITLIVIKLGGIMKLALRCILALTKGGKIWDSC